MLGPVLLAFAPFLAMCLLRGSVRGSLWMAAAAGLSVDLFSDDPIGLHTLNYVMTARILYGVKRRLSYEEPLHLGLYSGGISFVSTLMQLFLLFLFDRRVPFSGKWALVDLFCMPIADGVYALVWIAAPLLAVQRLRYKWDIYWVKKKNLSRTSH